MFVNVLSNLNATISNKCFQDNLGETYSEFFSLLNFNPLHFLKKHISNSWIIRPEIRKYLFQTKKSYT